MFKRKNKNVRLTLKKIVIHKTLSVTGVTIVEKLMQHKVFNFKPKRNSVTNGTRKFRILKTKPLLGTNALENQ